MKEFLTNIKFVWTYTKGQRLKILCVSILNIVGIFLSVVSPIIYAKIIVNITDENIKQLILITIALLINNLINILRHNISQICADVSYRNIFNNIQISFAKKVLELSNDTIDKNGSGVIMSRLTSDTNSLANIFNSLNLNFFSMISKIGIFIAIFIVNKLVFIFILIMTSIISLIEKIRTKKRSEKDKISRERKEKLSGFVGELVRGSKDIKMLNAEENFTKELNKKASSLNEAYYDQTCLNTRYIFFSGCMRDTMDLLLIVLYIYLITKSSLSVASAIVLMNYSNQTSSFIHYIGFLLENIKSFNLSCNRIYEVIDSDKFKKENFGTAHLPHINGDFEFKNVHFSYGKEKVLKGINFKVNANETVAFVGKSGAGKTTIFNLLCKMYEPQKGTITIDGKNIKKLDKDTIRGNITIISQNPYIFNMTIRENLKLVKENLTEDEMIEACKLACLHDYIMTLPDKYDTVIGEGGVNLSGGQKQRLAIARAFVQKTEIILFDEATSALDNETQSKIQKAIENMKKDYTILIIAHRLSTIINADRILYIEDGIVKSEGTHKELLKNCESYKKLYKSELKK